jgi:hypothetical protein
VGLLGAFVFGLERRVAWHLRLATRLSNFYQDMAVLAGCCAAVLVEVADRGQNVSLIVFLFCS